MLLKDVKTLDDFFEWFRRWAAEGDKMEVGYSDQYDCKVFEVYNVCGQKVAEYCTELGLEICL